MINNAINHKPMPVYGVGRQRRAWLYAKDHNITIERVIQDAKCGEIYNVGEHNEKENTYIIIQV